MVADALVYHPTVSHYLKFIATTVGRDKVLRTIQYFARFYSWYLLRTNHSASDIRPWNVVKAHFGLSRKLLRVGKFVEHFKAAAVAADTKGADPVLKFLAVGRQLGYGIYLTLDTITYFDAAGIRPSLAAKKLQQEAYKAWFVGILCNTIAGFYTLAQIRQKVKKVEKTDADGVVESKKLQREDTATKIQLVSDLCDLTVPGFALGYFPLDDGIVGLAGTVSSLLGVYTQWKKTA